MEWSYKLEQQYTKYIIVLVDPVFNRPAYLSGIGKTSGYSWSNDSLYARCFTKETAQKHLDALIAGSDKQYGAYHDHWKAYWQEIGSKKEA